MKKITLMMSLLLSLGSMTASAQVLDRSGWKVTTSGECKDGNTGHANAIIDGDNNTYWHSNWGGQEASGDNTSTVPQFFQLDLGSVQEFNKIGYMPRPNLDNGIATHFKLYVSDTAFPSTANGTKAADIVNALDATKLAIEGDFDYSDGQVTMKKATANKMLRGQYVLFVVTASGGQTTNKFASCAEFYLSKDTEITKDITYHYMVDGVEYASKTITKLTTDDSPITTPTLPFLTNGDLTATEDGFKVACTSRLPFVASSTFEPTKAHWYAMTLRGESGNYVISAKGGEAVGTETISKSSQPSLADKYQWAFVGNYKDGYKIYSKSAAMPLTLAGQLKLVEGEGSIFRPYEKKNGKGFAMYVTAGQFINRHGENKIATWTDGETDDGSTFRIQEPETYIIEYAKAFLDNIDNNAAPENALWGVNINTEEYRAAYQAATAEGATDDKIATLKDQNEKSATFVNPIEEGKYYRLYNVSDTRRWLTVQADNNNQMNCDASAEKAVTSVVSFESIASEPGQYRMKMEGKILGKYKADNTPIVLVGNDSEEKGSFTVNVIQGNKFTFFDKASNNAHSYIHCNTHSLVGWEASAPSQWYVVPANDVEIAMTAANDKHYASAYLPFDVKAVNGAQAYVGELNDAKNVLNMTTVSSVPANQGFVLVGDAEKATLTIGNAEPLTITNNALTGYNTKFTLTDDNRADYLVFGKSSEGIVGFYKPAAALTTIAANKAFIAASSLTAGAGAIAMNFGGNTTGINNAVVASENAPIFDLSGRRVVKAVKGGVYIQNGKKFVK